MAYRFFTKIGPSSFQCRICSKTRTQRCDIYKHIKTEHPSYANESSENVETPEVLEKKEISIESQNQNMDLKTEKSASKEKKISGKCSYCNRVILHKFDQHIGKSNF